MVERRRVMNLLNVTLDAGVKIDNVQLWCREHGVAVRTFYRHRSRIRAEGQWRERSRRPHHSPGVTPLDLDAWICKLRADLTPDNGADYIRDALLLIAAETKPAWQTPSRSTINRVLARHDLLQRNPAKRPRSSWRRFSYARPRDCYQIDATVVSLVDGHDVVVFEVIDDCTRQLVGSRAALAETTRAAIAAITAAFTEYGTSALVLSDNGSAFTSRPIHRSGVRSTFTRTVNEWGARLIHSSPYHPQTCGKVERHHQTFKKWLRAQESQPADLAELQQFLDIYRTYYNTQRRHSALPGRSTPHHAWTTATSHGGPASLPIQADATVYHCRVYDNGTIGVGMHRIGIGLAARGTTLTAIRDGDHATVYGTDGQPIGRAYLTPGKSYIPLTPTK